MTGPVSGTVSTGTASSGTVSSGQGSSGRVATRRRGRFVAAVLVAALIVTAVTSIVVRDLTGPSVVARQVSAPGVLSVVLDDGPDALDLAPTGGAGPENLTGTNELTAALYYPAEWRRPRRVVYLQHGGHTVCARPDRGWPCDTPADRTPSYLGYDRLAEALVDAGFVVVSISANATIGRAEVASFPAIIGAYDQLLLAAQQGDGPWGDLLRGHLDLSGVSLVGHSRGGDAVAQYVADGAAAPLLPVTAAVLLAPVLPVDIATGLLPTLTVRTLVLVGTCDGDAGDDGLAYGDQDPAIVTVRTVTGANHNFYNTVWTPGTGVADAVDDAARLVGDRPECAPGNATRLSRQEQQATAADLVVTFLAEHRSPAQG